MSPRRRFAALVVLLVAVVVGAVVAAGGGSGTPRSVTLSQTAVASALSGSPAVLASLHAQSNQLLGGGTVAFRARLRSLRGHPVVVNEWASWCGPCQSEFPVFQRSAVKYGRQVAFIGVDARDSDGAARDFLRRFPLSYPSYTDPRERFAGLLHTIGGIPQTIYFGAGGAELYDHAGPYESTAALNRDIRVYLHR